MVYLLVIYRQLGREAEAKKDHRYRPHALPQGCLPKVQERLPDRPAQERSWRQQVGVNPFPFLKLKERDSHPDGRQYPPCPHSLLDGPQRSEKLLDHVERSSRRH